MERGEKGTTPSLFLSLSLSLSLSVHGDRNQSGITAGRERGRAGRGDRQAASIAILKNGQSSGIYRLRQVLLHDRLFIKPLTIINNLYLFPAKIH